MWNIKLLDRIVFETSVHKVSECMKSCKIVLYLAQDSTYYISKGAEDIYFG